MQPTLPRRGDTSQLMHGAELGGPRLSERDGFSGHYQIVAAVPPGDHHLGPVDRA